MASEKTILLGGAEQEVKLSGQNCDIRNDGTDTVYISRCPNIVPDADGVVSVPAGQAVKYRDIHGVVYLFGTGKVILCGNDYGDLVFKTAATSSGEGGVDQDARNAINGLTVTVTENKSEFDDHAADDTIHHTAEDIIRTAATAISNPNLLINPDFRINQRGQTEYTEGYTVDGWKAWKYVADNIGTVSVTDSGVILVSSGEGGSIRLWSYLENADALIGKTVTISFEVEDITNAWYAGQDGASGYYKFETAGAHSYTFTWEDTSVNNRIAIGLLGSSAGDAQCKLKWIKLELGSVATPFTPPDPATELAKCQRYFYSFNPRHISRPIVGDGMIQSKNGAGFLTNIPVPMRTHPTISMEGTWVIEDYMDRATNEIDVSDATISTLVSLNTATGVYIYIDPPADFAEDTVGKRVFLRGGGVNDDGVYPNIYLSAEL